MHIHYIDESKYIFKVSKLKDIDSGDGLNPIKSFPTCKKLPDVRCLAPLALLSALLMLTLVCYPHPPSPPPIYSRRRRCAHTHTSDTWHQTSVVLPILGNFQQLCARCQSLRRQCQIWLNSELGTWGIFGIFSTIKNYFFAFFYVVNDLFLHQSYLKSPLPVKLTW